MKILIVSQYFWPETFRINDVVRSLSLKNINIELMTGKPNYPSGSFFKGYKFLGFNFESFHGSNIFRIPITPRGAKNPFHLFLNYFSFVVAGLLFSPFYYFNKKFNVIFVYGVSPIFQAIPALLLGRIKKTPVIIWVQDLWPESLEATGHIKNKLILKIVSFIVRFIYARSDLLLVQSSAFILPVKALAGNTPVIYYPNSVENIFFDFPETVAPCISSLQNGFTVLFAGNIGLAQSVHVIVDAAIALKDITDIRFVILGTGSRWEWMRQQVELHGLQNIFLEGHYPIETMPALMRKASALLVSLSDQPIFAATIPNKVQAYLAVGRPILACLNGEGARIVDEAKAGICIPAEDSKGLASAILQLYNMPIADRDVMGQNGRHYFKNHFDHDKLVDDLILHFESYSS